MTLNESVASCGRVVNYEIGHPFDKKGWGCNLDSRPQGRRKGTHSSGNQFQGPEIVIYMITATSRKD